MHPKIAFGYDAVAPTYAAKGAAGARAVFALIFTLLTPPLSASSLAVPSLVRLRQSHIGRYNRLSTTFSYNEYPQLPKTIASNSNNIQHESQLNSNYALAAKLDEWKLNFRRSNRKAALKRDHTSGPYLSWYKIEKYRGPIGEDTLKSIERDEDIDGEHQWSNTGTFERSHQNASVNNIENNSVSHLYNLSGSNSLLNVDVSSVLNATNLSSENSSENTTTAYKPLPPSKAASFSVNSSVKSEVLLRTLKPLDNPKSKRSGLSLVIRSVGELESNQKVFNSSAYGDVVNQLINQTNSSSTTEKIFIQLYENTRSSSGFSNITNGDKVEEISFIRKYGYKIAAVAISLTGAITISLVAVLRCLRATRRATRALAVPIPLLPEDRTPLNAEPEHPVPMLSVQSAGCAGMERLGVPARTSLSSPPDDRGHISRRMRVDAIQARDILVRDATLLSDRQVRSSHHHHYHRGGCANRGIDNCVGHTGMIRCPHHVPLPDSEWGQDRDLQIRTRYQQAEITRSYIKPPPNKTVLDVPEQSYNLFTSSSLGSAAISCNLGPNYSNQHSNQHLQHQQQQQQQQQKSKPNVITKFFSRKSSPKSPSSTSSSSSTTTSSTSSSSSSSSSLCSSPALPISTASALTTTSCNLGTSIGPSLSTSTLSGISTTTASTGCTTSPVGLALPANNLTTTLGTSNSNSNSTTISNNHHQFHQNLLVGSTNHGLSSASTLQVVDSSCNISTTSLASSSSSSSIGSLSAPSIDCCYTQATSVRPRTPITNISNNANSTMPTTSTTDGASNNNNQQQQQQQPQHQQHRDHI